MDTIRSSQRISELFSSGSRITTPFVILIYQKRDKEYSCSQSQKHDLPGRVAFIAGRKIGNAVWRNRAKRRLRALNHDLGGPWLNFDVVFLAKVGLVSTKYSKVLQACNKALNRSPLGDERLYG